MGNSLFLGKLVFAGVAGSPALYFGLIDVTFQKNREYKVEVDFGGGNQELIKTENDRSLNQFSFSNRIYQGIERGTRCFIKSWQPEEIYRVVMKFGKAKGYFNKGNWELGGVLGVRTVNLKFEGGIEKQFAGLYERDDNNLDKYGIAVYKSESGGGILLFEKGTPSGERKQNEKRETITKELLEGVKKELTGKQIKVRRSVVSAWSRMEGEKCKVTSIKQGEPIYRNYGRLQIGDKEVEGVRVLDWVSFNNSGVKREEGQWQINGTGWGRYDHFSLEEKIEELIVGKASDIKVEASGINDGKGNRIEWNDSFKPTITLTLDK